MSISTTKKPPTLTPREREVLTLLAEGQSSQEVADRLCISKRTVDFHSSAMYRKFKVCNRIEMLKVARQAGLLQGGKS